MATTGTENGGGDAGKSRRDKALEEYRKRLIDHRELEDKLKKSELVVFLEYSR